jgi:DNA polymerase-1
VEERKLIMNKKIVLGIDFINLVMGSQFGESLVNSKGVAVGAIKGFFFKLRSLKDAINPDYIILANDLSRERTFRRKMYKPYKATRKPKDMDIVNQLKYTSQLCALLGLPFINNELYEADDILGMISKYCQDNDMEMIIASTDKDLYQLLDTNVCILSPKERDVIDLNWLYNKYKLTPTQWIELKMLMGDRGDNIPGIDRVGEVTALRLIQQYQSINNIYENINQLKPQLQEALRNGIRLLLLVRDLVTIVKDYNLIGFQPSMMDNTGRFEPELFAVLEELEIPSLYNVMKYSLLVDKKEVMDGFN